MSQSYHRIWPKTLLDFDRDLDFDQTRNLSGSLPNSGSFLSHEGQRWNVLQILDLLARLEPDLLKNTDRSKEILLSIVRILSTVIMK